MGFYATFFFPLELSVQQVYIHPLSFPQSEGQEFIYNVVHVEVGHPWLAAWGFEIGKPGGQFRIVITNINQTTAGVPNTDTIWTRLYYRNTTSDAWTLIESEEAQCFYHPQDEYAFGSWAYFVCTNNTALTIYFSQGTWHWTPGPSGYDGTMEDYGPGNTAEVGLPNERKLVYSFNSQGVLQRYELYNGTGTGWDLFYKVVLIEGDTTWIIILIVLFPLIGLGLAALVLYRRRKEM